MWLTDGRQGADVGEILRLVARVHDGAADFVVLVPSGDDVPEIRPGVLSVLSGVALGIAVVVKHSAISAEGGFDAAAPGPEVAVWELCVRLALADRHWDVVETSSTGLPSLAERAGPDGARWLVSKHAQVYAGRMAEVLLDRERLIGKALRENHALEAMIESSLGPSERGLRVTATGSRPRCAARSEVIRTGRQPRGGAT